MSIYTNCYRRHTTRSYRAKTWLRHNSVNEAKRVGVAMVKVLITVLWLGAVFFLPHFFR